MSKVTIKDVAKKAGVAPSTVSNALNPASKKISDKKRQEILKLVEEMAYVPDFSAQKIASKNNRRIGFFIRTSANKSASQISEQFIHYMNKYAVENNLDLINIIIPASIDDYAKEVLYRITTYGITDLIIYGLEIDYNLINELTKLNINKIFIEIPVNERNSHFISIDNYKSQLNLVSQVIRENEVSSILYITGDLNSHVGMERYNAIKELKKKSDLTIDTIESMFDFDYTYNKIKNIDLSKYDYIACGSDDMLIAVIRCLTKSNLSPVLSGFDNSFVLRDTDYKIYTIEQNVKELCFLVISMFIKKEYSNVLIEGEVKKNKSIDFL